MLTFGFEFSTFNLTCVNFQENSGHYGIWPNVSYFCCNHYRPDTELQHLQDIRTDESIITFTANEDHHLSMNILIRCQTCGYTNQQYVKFTFGTSLGLFRRKMILILLLLLLCSTWFESKNNFLRLISFSTIQEISKNLRSMFNWPLFVTRSISLFRACSSPEQITINHRFSEYPYNYIRGFFCGKGRTMFRMVKLIRHVTIDLAPQRKHDHHVWPWLSYSDFEFRLGFKCDYLWLGPTILFKKLKFKQKRYYFYKK